MRKIKQWFNNNKEGILKSIYALPIAFAISISIFHCIEWFNISNPSLFAVSMSIGIEIAATTTLVALLFGKINFSIVFTFILVTAYQIMGNIFYSFNYIDENGTLFTTWVKFFTIVLGVDSEWTIDKHKFLLSILSGAIVPALSLLSLHLISTFKLKEKTPEPIKEYIETPLIMPSSPVEEKKEEFGEPVEEIILNTPPVITEPEPDIKDEEITVAVPPAVIEEKQESPKVDTETATLENVSVENKRGRKPKSNIVLGNPNTQTDEEPVRIIKSREPAIVTKQANGEEKTEIRKLNLPGFKK
jgi:hypothetical protein